MRWQMGRRSDNVEDQRGSGCGGGGMVVGGLGTLVLALIAMALGIDPAVVLNSSFRNQRYEPRSKPRLVFRPKGRGMYPKRFIQVLEFIPVG